ncbi:PAS domain-containing protein [Dongia sp.]|uniref:PAS domain-containing protein n=1 Tax=Dongia sp. TaxID=1977262 RepID=UPI0035B2DE7F
MGSWFRLVGTQIDSSLTSPRLRQLLDYWRRLAGEGVPFRTQIEPADLKPLLPYLMLVDLTPEPLRVFYRLVGTEVVRFTGLEITGRYLDEIELDKFAEDDLLSFYRQVRDHRQPGAGIAEYEIQGKRALRTEYVICPLLDTEGALSKCIVLEDFQLGQDITLDILPIARLR